MLFHFPQRNIADIELTLKIENHYIERVEDFNFLGITIHETLDWTLHIDKVANKISQTLGILNKLKHVLPKYILKTMYNALIVPHFNYSIYSFNSNRLSKLHKKATRIITCSKYNAHTEPLLKYLNLLKIDDILKRHCVTLTHKYANNNAPLFCNSLCSYNANHHDHHSKQNLQLAVQYSHTIRASHEPFLLRTMPPCITGKVYTHSLQGFSTYLKKYLLSQYNDSCTIVNVTIYGRGFGFILIILLLVGFYIQKSYVRFSYTFDRLDF